LLRIDLGILESAVFLISISIGTVIRTRAVVKIAAEHPPKFLVDSGRIVIEGIQ
jgi:hypothetical protein